MKEKKYEERIIEGKKIRLKIINELHGAFAGLDGKTISLNEKTKNSLSKSELDSVLYHERGHFTLTNSILTYLPYFIGIILVSYIFLRYKIKDLLFFNLPIISTLILFIFVYIISIIASWLIELPFAWTKEILADWYAVKRTKGTIFRKTLRDFYRHNKQNSKSSPYRFHKMVILHPPQPLRLKIIKLMEGIRDKGAKS